MAVFFVDNMHTAKALLQVSRKIQDDQYFKRNRNHSEKPIEPLISVNDLYHIQMCLRNRYNYTAKSLDLCNLTRDPGRGGTL
ncbi:hypothetical protein GDO86_009140 [Hymenochirus boettgeri]|uniref:Uncharacterized protein n=1 Tax=Hymenochirus boettgeri TaxID=247094 RepID=A0A8T2JK13_9PIPI|nr:hypothetical protein GDO86_009140 [Hymenochirus boettgeri]